MSHALLLESPSTSRSRPCSFICGMARDVRRRGGKLCWLRGITAAYHRGQDVLAEKVVGSARLQHGKAGACMRERACVIALRAGGMGISPGSCSP